MTEKSAAEAPERFRAILGEKMGMTQIFHPVTRGLCAASVVKTGPCRILRVKSPQGADGYGAVVLAYGERAPKSLPKPELGQFKKAGIPPARRIREVRIGDVAGIEPGQVVSAARIFKTGDYVDVQGVSKGKGFAGVMKRHNFRGLPASHGASDKERSPGSLTSRRSLGHVLKGQRMAGRMGAELVTMHKIEVLAVDGEKHLLYLGGSVPGPRGSAVTILETVKPRKARPQVHSKAAKAAPAGKKPTAPKK